MNIQVKGLTAWWFVPLLSLASLAAPSSDLRLVEAVKSKDREAVRSLLKQDADLNAPEADGSTALAWASHWDDLETADLLIRAGAKVNAANEYGATPLWMACTNGNAAMVEKLLQAGANPNAALTSGETALIAAVHTGNVDAIKSLLAHGADVNAKEIQRAQSALMWAVAERRLEVARLLIEHGADVHARSKGGFTPLLFAVAAGDLDLAQTLLTAGANANEATPDPDRMSALLVASAKGHEKIALFLLEKGADPNATDGKEGYTALHHAASRRNMLELVKALLARGANPNARLVQAPPRPNDGKGGISLLGATPALLAAVIGNAPAILALVEGGADPQIGTQGGTTPLLIVAGVGRNPDLVPTTDQKGRYMETAKMLVQLHSDVNAVGDNGWTALHGAAYTASDEIIEYLAGKGANLNAFDSFGQTPLSITLTFITAGIGANFYQAPRAVHRSTADLLLRLGATPLEASGVKRMDVLPEGLRSGEISPYVRALAAAQEKAAGSNTDKAAAGTSNKAK